jgi:hypothetical protein
LTNRLMMTSASTIALIAGGAQQALAQDGAFPAGYTLNVQGTYGILNNPYLDKTSSPPAEFEDKIGDKTSERAALGSLSLGRDTSPGKDMVFGLTLGSSLDNDRSASASSGGDVVTTGRSNDLAFAALDFELGETMPMQGADVRLFYGVRALASNSQLEKLGRESLGDDFGENSVLFESKYAGAGPRIGVGFSTQPSIGQFGFSGDISTSYLFGSREDTLTVRETTFIDGITTTGGGGSGFSENKNVTTLEAQIGADYYLSPTSKVSFGYHAQQMWNVDRHFDEDSGDFEDAKPRLIHGVFVGYTTTF